MSANLENSAVAIGMDKVTFHSNLKERQCRKYSSCHTIAVIAYTSKDMFKILQARFQKYLNQELPGVLIQSGLEKAEEQEIKLLTFVGSWRKQGSFRKTSTSASLTTPKPLTCGSQQTGKFLKRWEYQATLPASWETCTQIKKSQSESGSVMSDSLGPHGLHSPWNSLGQNTGVGSLSLPQGIFPTQGLNPNLPHCRRILYQLRHKGSPRILEW